MNLRNFSSANFGQQSLEIADLIASVRFGVHLPSTIAYARLGEKTVQKYVSERISSCSYMDRPNPSYGIRVLM